MVADNISTHHMRRNRAPSSTHTEPADLIRRKIGSWIRSRRCLDADTSLRFRVRAESDPRGIDGMLPIIHCQWSDVVVLGELCDAISLAR